MKKYILVGLFFLALHVQAGLVQVPEDCLSNKILPCLVKSDKAFSKKINIGSKSIVFESEGKFLVKFEKVKGHSFDIKVYQGQVIIDTVNHLSTKPYLVQGIEFNYPSVLIISQTDSMSIMYDKAQANYTTHSFVNKKMELLKTEFVSRPKVEDFLKQFSKYSNMESTEFKDVINDYNARFKKEVESETAIMQRKIAQAESEQKRLAEARQKEALDKKRTRELFFQRTFER